MNDTKELVLDSDPDYELRKAAADLRNEIGATFFECLKALRYYDGDAELAKKYLIEYSGARTLS